MQNISLLFEQLRPGWSLYQKSCCRTFGRACMLIQCFCMVQAPATAPAKPTNFVGKSTFSTPAGITIANINSKVQCTQ